MHIIIILRVIVLIVFGATDDFSFMFVAYSLLICFLSFYAVVSNVVVVFFTLLPYCTTHTAHDFPSVIHFMIVCFLLLSYFSCLFYRFRI